MRVPPGDEDYHPVLILWPGEIDFPLGGEIDYAETEANAGDISFFLHYSAQNRQTSARRTVDITQWHNYAVEWTLSCVVGFLDGAEWFRDCDASHQPPGPMHQTIQLDNFGDGSVLKESFMHVDWVRMYPL